MATEVLEALRSISKQILRVMYPSLAQVLGRPALVNTLSPGDRVLVFERWPTFPSSGATSTKDGLSGGIRAWKLARQARRPESWSHS